MSKECKAAGLGRVFFDYRADPVKAKREEAPRRGRFVLDSPDYARRLPGLVGALNRHNMPIK